MTHDYHFDLEMVRFVLSKRFKNVSVIKLSESLILAQNEHWRRGLGMQVERDPVPSILRKSWRR
jgi:hypothetical protein